MKTKKIISLLLAIVLALGLSSAFVAAEDSPAYYDSVEHVTNRVFSDTIDGIVDETKWGTPNATFTRSIHFYPNGQPNWTHVNITSWNYLIDGKRVFENQSIKFYVRRAEEGIYLAVKFINAIERDQAVAGTTFGKRAGLDISIGTYDETYNVKRDANNKELFRTYRLMEDYNAANNSYTAVAAYPDQNGVAQSGAKLNSYAIGFENQTYTYECIIPYDDTHILKDHDLVLSLAVRDAYVEKSNKTGDTTTFSLSNVFNISDVCRATTKQGYGSAATGAVNGDERTYPFYRLNPLRIRIDEKCYVNNTLAGVSGQAPKADGNVSTEEYGAPVIVTSPTHAKATWTSHGYWNSESTIDTSAQRAKVYMTNDTEYLYVAATLDPADANVNVNASNYGHPQMSLTLSKYVPETKVARVGNKEQFSYYRIGSTNGGVIKANLWANALDSFTLSDSDWEVRYDAEAKTYIYELRIPLSTTNIDIRETTQIAVSIQIGDANHGTNGSENKRYNIGGTGVANYTKAKTEGQYPHANQPVLVMTLNQNHGVTDTAVAQIGVSKFGTVADALADAKSGETVTLLAAGTLENVHVQSDVTLDLNGFVLTADTVLAQGNVIDSTDGKGGIKIAKNADDNNKLILAANNGMLPLYDEEFAGYRFFTCTFEHEGREKDGDYQFGYMLKMSDAAFALLVDANDDGVIDADIDLNYDITIQVDEKEPDRLLRMFKAEIMEEYAEKQLLEDGKTYAAVLRVTGFDRVTTQTVNLTSTNAHVLSGTGVVIAAANSVSYTYPNAQ